MAVTRKCGHILNMFSCHPSFSKHIGCIRQIRPSARSTLETPKNTNPLSLTLSLSLKVVFWYILNHIPKILKIYETHNLVLHPTVWWLTDAFVLSGTKSYYSLTFPPPRSLFCLYSTMDWKPCGSCPSQAFDAVLLRNSDRKLHHYIVI